ncbi:hypothetical protein ACFYTQ_27420 [Nocardia sp. NPDC004068]|uniref:hypothetical protein n=1 Tax=Nocardia sp. NPDC004068 TaxID=3364303 RepID=UPI0036B6F7DF
MERIPFDLTAYERRVRSGPCFVCAIVAGTHDSDLEQVIAEDEENIAFLRSGSPAVPPPDRFGLSSGPSR